MWRRGRADAGPRAAARFVSRSGRALQLVELTPQVVAAVRDDLLEAAHALLQLLDAAQAIDELGVRLGLLAAECRRQHFRDADHEYDEGCHFEGIHRGPLASGWSVIRGAFVPARSAVLTAGARAWRGAPAGRPLRKNGSCRRGRAPRHCTR